MVLEIEPRALHILRKCSAHLATSPIGFFNLDIINLLNVNSCVPFLILEKCPL